MSNYKVQQPYLFASKNRSHLKLYVSRIISRYFFITVSYYFWEGLFRSDTKKTWFTETSLIDCICKRTRYLQLEKKSKWKGNCGYGLQIVSFQIKQYFTKHICVSSDLDCSKSKLFPGKAWVRLDDTYLISRGNTSIRSRRQPQDVSKEHLNNYRVSLRYFEYIDR